MDFSVGEGDLNLTTPERHYTELVVLQAQIRRRPGVLIYPRIHILGHEYQIRAKSTRRLCFLKDRNIFCVNIYSRCLAMRSTT